MNKYLFTALFILLFQGQDAFARPLVHQRIHEAALLGKTKQVLNLLPKVDQKEVNRVAVTAAGNGHIGTLKAVMKYTNKKTLHPDQMGINLTAKYAAHFGDLEIVTYLLEHQLKNIPHPDQEGINNILIQAASYGDLNLTDYIVHHTVQGVPHPDQEGMNNAAVQAVVSGYSDVLIYLTNAAVGPRPDPVLIQEVELEVGDDSCDNGDEVMDEQLPSPIEKDNTTLFRQDVEIMGQGFPAPWKDL